MKYLIGGVATLAAAAGIMFWINNASSSKNPAPTHDLEYPVDADTSESSEGQEKPSEFGIDRLQGRDVKPVPFDGKRAMKYLEKICAPGPRISGSSAMRKQQDLIKTHFDGLGAKVQYQTFEATRDGVRGKVEMTNIIISFQPEKKRRVILCSHYDTRPIADQEPDPRDWKKPFVSANDGGSGVALLMELGNHMKDLKTNVGVDFVIFDGEEYVFNNKGSDRDRYFIGSEHFAQTWRRTKSRCDYAAAILLDMVAGEDIRFPVEINSYRRSSELCKAVWTIANEQNIRAFQWKEGHEVQDDHISLQKVGIPAIDIIDFDYKHWHRLSDRPENCSGDSMHQVANVLSIWLQQIK